MERTGQRYSQIRLESAGEAFFVADKMIYPEDDVEVAIELAEIRALAETAPNDPLPTLSVGASELVRQGLAKLKKNEAASGADRLLAGMYLRKVGRANSKRLA